jgi:hypothetical protein
MKINDLRFSVFNKMNYILEIAKMIDGPDGPYLGWDFVGYYNNLPSAMRDAISTYPRFTEAKNILAAVGEARAGSSEATRGLRYSVKTAESAGYSTPDGYDAVTRTTRVTLLVGCAMTPAAASSVTDGAMQATDVALV